MNALSRRRRGALLVAYVAMIPLGFAILVAALGQMQVQFKASALSQQHAQARQLAESALTLYLNGAAAPFRGSLTGAGQYWVERTASGFAAIGETPGAQAAVQCRIECAWGASRGAPPAPLAIDYRLIPRT